jgi:hypothetical protein
LEWKSLYTENAQSSIQMGNDDPNPWKKLILPAGILALIAAVLLYMFGNMGNISINPSPKIYEGTYSGDFNYEYTRITYDSNGNEVRGPLTPASFTLTITMAEENDLYGRAYPIITYVKCSDPIFGATGGVKPQGGMTSVEFKANPPASPAVRLSDHNEAILITFPNGNKLIIPANAGGSLSGRFMIASDGKSMYSSPDYPDDLWSAVSGEGPFTAINQPGQYYETNYGSWKLTKTS